VVVVILLALEASCAGIRCEMCLWMDETTIYLEGRRYLKNWATARRPAIIQDGLKKFRRPALSLGHRLSSVHVGWYEHFEFEDKSRCR
jgi:hypothetical protein